MKLKIYFLTILFLGVIYFTNDTPAEIADRVMIHAIGIDPTDSGYRVTMQTFTPDSSGSETSIDPSKPNVSLVSGSGKTVSDAVRNCYSKLGGNVFIGQNQLIIFGRETDLSKTEDVFGFFLSSSESFLNVHCAAAKTTAEEILKVPISGNTVTSEKYPQMIASAAKNGRCVETDFMQLICAMLYHDGSVVLPEFSISSEYEQEQLGGGEQSGSQPQSQSQSASQTPEQLQQAKLEIRNGAVYTQGKFAAEITYEQMGLFGMLCGEGQYIHTDISSAERDYSKTYRLRSREVSAEISDGEIVISIRCRVSPKNSEMFSEPKQRDESNLIATTLLEKKSQSLADDLCEKFTPQLLNCSDYLKRFYPDIYSRYADHPESLLERVRYEVSIEL